MGLHAPKLHLSFPSLSQYLNWVHFTIGVNSGSLANHIYLEEIDLSVDDGQRGPLILCLVNDKTERHSTTAFQRELPKTDALPLYPPPETLTTLAIHLAPSNLNSNYCILTGTYHLAFTGFDQRPIEHALINADNKIYALNPDILIEPFAYGMLRFKKII